MIFFIPGELISLLTFPGVILHEIAHRFFCDINNVPVYGIDYFNLGSKVAGSVFYEKPNSAWHSFFIAIAPLIINSLVCMLLTMPFGIQFLLNTSFVDGSYPLSYLFISWVGYSIGFHAIPSNQDVKGLIEEAPSGFSKFIFIIFTGIIYLFNIEYIGFFFHLAYAFAISFFLPLLLISSF